MTIFNAYFKIMRNNLGSMAIYIIVFLGVSMIITANLHGSANTAFADTRTNIAVLNEDGDQALAAGLAAYLGRNATLVTVKDTAEDVQDALFYGNISYALRIPAGFSESFTSGSDAVTLQKVAAAQLDTSVSMDFLVQRYLQLARLHIQGQPDASQTDIVTAVAKDLDARTDVRVNLYGGSAQTSDLTFYFLYLSYCILAIMIMGVTSFMMAMNDTDLANRNLCAPVPPLRMNMQIALGNGIFALVVWGICCAVSFAMYGSVPAGLGTVLLCVNALAVTVVALSIAFLAGKFIRDRGVQSAISNVVSLGLSFLSGVFVEQSLLGEGVLRFARFEPIYWYVKAVNDIRNLADFSAQSVQGILNSIGIQLGFAAAILLVAMALAKNIRPKREI